MSLVRTPSRLRRPAAAMVALSAGLVLTLAGCSGSDSAAPQDPSGGGSQAGQGGRQRTPGVSGLIAAVSGKTLQVQGTDAQTAVTYTAKTTFTSQSTATAKALKTGLCAVVRSTADASSTATTVVTATSVTLSPEVDGSCEGGFGGGGFGGGARPSGMPSGAMPSGAMPSGAMPSGMPGGGGMGASGKVTSADGSTFVVASTGATNGSSAAPTDVTVTTTGDTTWQLVQATTAKAVKVGTCAQANGTTSSTGALTATTIRLSKAAADGTCSTGFGGRGGQAAGGQGAPSGTPTNG